MAEYDTLTENSYHAFSYHQAAARNVNSLKNWIAGAKTIGRSETAYLDKREDLVNLAGCEDGAMEQIGWLLEDLKVWFYTRVQMSFWSSAKRKKRFIAASEHIFFSGPWSMARKRESGPNGLVNYTGTARSSCCAEQFIDDGWPVRGSYSYSGDICVRGFFLVLHMQRSL